MHIHVTKGNAAAKFDVLPVVALVKNHGFRKAELKLIEAVIEENRELIIERRNGWFKIK